MTADFKHSLRKLEFPASAKEALPRIESILVNRNKQNYAIQLISEFIFLETETRKGSGGPQSPQSYAISQMTAFQEFQLILVLIEFFSEPSPDSTRNAVFLSLFGSNPTPQRSKVLCHLISTAISGSVAPLLSSAGAWMQQVGCTTPSSLEVAQALVSDFIKFSRKISDQLKQLPLVAPNFAANLMTAIADLYMNEKQGNGVLLVPPDGLLDVFTEWVTENPGLCLASQQSPAGIAIAMPVTTPLAGLIRWTVLAPLVSQRVAYSELHLSLLQTLLDIVNTGPPTAINAQHLAQIVTSLQAYATKISTNEIPTKPEDDTAYMKCMERFAQAIQVAISSNCIFGNIRQLVCMLQKLPPHPLMTIVINTNKTVL